MGGDPRPERAGVLDVVIELRGRVVGVLEERGDGLRPGVVLRDVLPEVPRWPAEVDERVALGRREQREEVAGARLAPVRQERLADGLVVRLDRFAQPLDRRVEVGLAEVLHPLQVGDALLDLVERLARLVARPPEPLVGLVPAFEQVDEFGRGGEGLAGGREVALVQPAFVDGLGGRLEGVAGREVVVESLDQPGEAVLELHVRLEVPRAGGRVLVPVEESRRLAVGVGGRRGPLLAVLAHCLAGLGPLRAGPLDPGRGLLRPLAQVGDVAAHRGYPYTSSGSKTRSPRVSPPIVRWKHDR